MTTMLGLRSILCVELGKAMVDAEVCRQRFAAPYSTYDSDIAFRESRGYNRGLARAIEILDGLDNT